MEFYPNPSFSVVSGAGRLVDRKAYEQEKGYCIEDTQVYRGVKLITVIDDNNFKSGSIEIKLRDYLPEIEEMYDIIDVKYYDGLIKVNPHDNDTGCQVEVIEAMFNFNDLPKHEIINILKQNIDLIYKNTNFKKDM